MSFSQKTVLFIHIDFYDYNVRIINEMRNKGFRVISFCEDPKQNLFSRFLDRISLDINDYLSWLKQKKFVKSILRNGDKFDYVFVIKGGRIRKEFLFEIRRLNPEGVFIQYLWDDVARSKNFQENRLYFDKIFSFDNEDCERYNLIFQPLFFCDDFRCKKKKDIKYDLFFSGWLHSDREDMIKFIIPRLENANYTFYIHLFTGVITSIKKYGLKNILFKIPIYVKFQKMSINENALLCLKSNVILDIQHKSQQGLTMRVFEALASKCKLITTNENIKRYDFFNERNVQVINRNDLNLDMEIFESQFYEIPCDIVEKYSLSNWISRIFDCDLYDEK